MAHPHLPPTDPNNPYPVQQAPSPQHFPQQQPYQLDPVNGYYANPVYPANQNPIYPPHLGIPPQHHNSLPIDPNAQFYLPHQPHQQQPSAGSYPYPPQQQSFPSQPFQSYPQPQSLPQHPGHLSTEPIYHRSPVHSNIAPPFPYSGSPQPNLYPPLQQAQHQGFDFSPSPQPAARLSTSSSVDASSTLHPPPPPPQPTFQSPHPTSVDPALLIAKPSASPSPFQPPVKLEPQPTPQPAASTASPVPPNNVPATTPSRPIKITLRLNPNAATAQSNMTSTRRGSHSTSVNDVTFSNSGRPKRNASIVAQKSMAQYDDDDDEEDAYGEEEEEVDEPDAEFEDDNDAYDAPVASKNTRSKRNGNSRSPVKARTSLPVTGNVPPPRRSDRSHKPPQKYAGDDDFEDRMMETSPVMPAARSTRATRGRIIDPDDEDEEPPKPVVTAPSTRRASGGLKASSFAISQPGPSSANGGKTPGKSRHSSADAESYKQSESNASESEAPAEDIEDYVEEEDEEEDDLFDSEDDYGARRKTRSSAAKRHPVRTTRQTPRRSTRLTHASDDDDAEYGAKPRTLRARVVRPNYELPPIDISAEIDASMLEDAIGAASGPGGRGRGGAGFAGGARFGAGAGGKGLGWNLKGRDLAQAMGDPDTSDSDDPLTPLKNGAGGAQRGGLPGPGGPGPSDVPNFGRINPKSNMADADPLGVDTNVTFDRVGGLDDHINQLKEMVALPLLYPELFQQFGIIPPRGVLFHGPPGTGKTLLARALAASCSNGNTKIAFFMRKGADVLSKWVGEAERQLRMLFEEARASQPSIIFFDEIDGLAPVRSSKQDQIHASLVSTLLALMDGMDGRGQVIVIGATNRPDAVDPALRRPGRFDREFYFPLPNVDARRKIIGINTREWDPPLADEVLDRLAVLTKGYGGADLRALCTEAALNAIQRRYPQIYSSSDRLLLEPKSIRVLAKDFMMAVKKIVPSSARSTASAAIPLPPHLVPFLEAPLARLNAAVDRALPPAKRATALEEAQWEHLDEGFEKEVMLQALDNMRTYRPRVLVYGESGMGQNHLGPAVLHHLEGFHVQSFDLATLLGDSTRTPESAIVQLFVEARRHQPSVIFIPSLAQWALTISDTARSTFRGLLESVPPSDRILVLALMDGEMDDLPVDVQGWFAADVQGRIELVAPDEAQRKAFFAELVQGVSRPPTEFPDGVPKRRRILEQLPLAPPLPPRAPTEAELARDTERDLAARNMISISFTSLVSEFMKKYRKPTALIKEEVMARAQYEADLAAAGGGDAPRTPPPSSAAHLAPTALAASSSAPAVLGSHPPTHGHVLVSVPEATGESVVVPAVSLVVDGTEVSSLPTVESVPVDPTHVHSNGDDAGLASVPTATTDESDSLAVPAANGIDAPSTASTSLPTSSTQTQPTSKWVPHDVDVDTLQRRLVRHKYCTPQDFLSDIDKIESNAQRSLDVERQLKVLEMVAHARMHVAGFDPKWTPEFERYAERMKARREKRDKEKAEAKAGVAVVGATVATVPETQAPGVDPSVPAPEAGGNGALIESNPPTTDPDAMDVDNGKRPRSSSSHERDGDDSHKRIRIDGVEGDGTSVPAASLLTATADVGLATSETLASVSTVPPPKGAEPGEPSQPIIEQLEPVTYPPFVAPVELVNALEVALGRYTEGYSVDKLESMRARLFDTLWRGRGEWDRTEMVRGMVDMVRRG